MVGSGKSGIVLLVALWSGPCLALIADEIGDRAVLSYADELLECGIYYQYTARGMSNNPRIATQLVDDVAHNSRVLLSAARTLFTSAGVSADAKYTAVMARARRLVKEKQVSGEGISELIFDAGKRCQILVTDYPDRMEKLLNDTHARQ